MERPRERSGEDIATIYVNHNVEARKKRLAATANMYPANGSVVKLSVADLTDEIISSSAILSYDPYKSCGENDKAAKGGILIDCLKEKLRLEAEKGEVRKLMETLFPAAVSR